jgi:hypothetical protein
LSLSLRKRKGAGVGFDVVLRHEMDRREPGKRNVQEEVFDESLIFPFLPLLRLNLLIFQVELLQSIW